MPETNRSIGGEGLEQGGPELGNDISRKDLSVKNAGDALTDLPTMSDKDDADRDTGDDELDLDDDSQLADDELGDDNDEEEDDVVDDDDDALLPDEDDDEEEEDKNL